MGAYGNGTPLLKPIFLTRFDMTKKTPPPDKLMGAYGHTTPPLLKAIFFDYRFDLTKKTPPPGQTVMGAYGHATPPLLKAIFFDYRFDMTKKTPPAKILWVQTNATPLLKAIFGCFKEQPIVVSV